MKDVTLTVTEAIEQLNMALDASFPFILVEGEVASFKVNQGKYAFFDIKDAAGSLGCFMMAHQLPFPLQDGMKVRVLAQPKITAWGKFSLTVREIVPVGEGSLKKAFELLKAKLEAEGLFDVSRKRSLPQIPQRIGVVSSSGAAGWADFLKILENRWGGLEIVLVDGPVQGLEAPEHIIGALEYLNQLSKPVDAIAVIRGGGSADDLAAFSHEGVVRAIATSRAPTIVGVGHETDVSLSDLTADKRAATPSNAAELLVPDKNEVLLKVERLRQLANNGVQAALTVFEEDHLAVIDQIEKSYTQLLVSLEDRLSLHAQVLRQLDPQAVLKRGYALVKKGGRIVASKADVDVHDTIAVELKDGTIGATVTDVK